MDSLKYLMDERTAEIKLERLALEIAEQLSEDNERLILFGIQKSGLVIASHIANYLRKLRSEVAVENISIDKQNPGRVEVSCSYSLDNCNIVVTDDVSNSGKTLLYAMKPLLSFYPKRIQTLVLVERMHKLFPIKPDYVGLSVATTFDDHITVEVANGKVLGAYLGKK